MKKNTLFIALAAGLLLSSCASKKELVGCREENKSLTSNLQTTKEDLAAKNARIASLEEQQRGISRPWPLQRLNMPSYRSRSTRV